MKIRTACMLSVLAGLAAGATAQDFAGPLPIREVTLPVVGAPAQPYSGRAIDTTYDCLSNTFGNGSATHLGNCNNVIEDISFAGSGWNLPYANPRVITEITYGVAVLTTPTTTEDIMLIFWDEDDLNYQGQAGTGTPMIRANAIPLAVVRVDSAGLGAGFYWQITNGLTGLAGGGVTVPADDNGIALQIAWVTDAFTPADTNGDTVPNWESLAGGNPEACPSATDRSIVFGSQSGAPVLGNPASPGSTTPDYGRDMLNNATQCLHQGVFIGNGGAAAAGGDIEHRYINASPQRGMMVRLKGDVVAPAPNCDVSMGAIADAGATTNVNVPASGVSVVCFTINGDATDASGQFLDIDTEGTAGDASIAIWNNGGALVASNDDGGSGTNAKLTFGIGRREKVGDGSQYNGLDGELAAGTYYLGVATGAAGDSSFGGGFSRASTGPGGAVTIRIATNTNGSALAPSVIPDLTEPVFNGGSPLAAPGAQSTAAGSGLRGVLWYSFNTCAISDPDNYLDIDTNSGSTPSADTEIFLFDSNGNLVATDDDNGTAALSQLSFGNVGPRPAPGDGLPYAGQNGALPAGTYYLAAGLFDVTTTNNRWHVRPTSGSNLTIQFTLATDSSGSCPVGCHGDCVADFDDGTGTGTPDGGVTIDDLLYYLGIFEQGVLCADVDDGSGTGTQDQGVTIDDLLYYLFRFEAGC